MEKEEIMKSIGIQIEGSKLVLVVVNKTGNGEYSLSNESMKIDVMDHLDQQEIIRFKDQVKATLDSINADKIGIIVRNAKAVGSRSPSPVSFKLEGLIQIYDKQEINMVWPQTISSFLKKNKCPLAYKFKYQDKALGLGFYLLANS